MQQTLILTLKVTFHMLLVTHVRVTSKYGVTSNKKQAAIQKQCFLWAIKYSFVKVTMQKQTNKKAKKQQR